MVVTSIPLEVSFSIFPCGMVLHFDSTPCTSHLSYLLLFQLWLAIGCDDPD